MTKVKSGVAVGGTYSRGKEHVGKKAIVEFRKAPTGKVFIEMKVRDFKVAYGRDLFLVEPLSGSGSLWVQDPKFV